MDIDAMTEVILGAQNFGSNTNVDKPSLKALFQTFDTDNNGLIDTLEFLATLAIISGMFHSSQKSFDLLNVLFYVLTITAIISIILIL